MAFVRKYWSLYIQDMTNSTTKDDIGHLLFKKNYCHIIMMKIIYWIDLYYCKQRVVTIILLLNTEMHIMTNNKKRLFQGERETWLRTLDYILQENINLKNLLSDVIKNGLDDQLLEQVEYYHNQFLNKDAVIPLLYGDIIVQGKEIENDITNSGALSKATLRKQDKLRMDMDKMEKEFNKLKYDFNEYLASAL